MADDKQKPEEKKDAARIYKALMRAKELFEGGKRESSEIIAEMRKILEQDGRVKIEYVEAVDAQSLEKLQTISGKALIAVAAKVGTTRLIDNILLQK